nr:MAG: putative RNA dependent RNA polymerase [Hanko alphapartitivirus 2]
MFFWPLFAYYKSHKGSSPLLWGYETFNGGWMRLNAELMHNYLRSSILMIDWKRFDKHALFSVIDDIFDIQRSYLDFSRGYVPTIDYSDTAADWDANKEARIQRLWQWTLDAFKCTPVLLPNGEVYSRRHAGLPSGLYTTQYLDSMYNCVMLITILSAMEIPLSKDMIIKLMGDDSLIRLLVCIQPNLHADFLLKMQYFASTYFNSTISIEKSKMINRPNGAEVLSYINHNGLPHRDPTSLLAQFYHTKARNPTPGKTMATAIGIAYASCGFDKQVYYVCKDVYAYYNAQGIEPDPTGLSLALGDDPFGIDPASIALTHFPSFHEIQANLTALDYVSSSVSRFWPTSHFSEPY